MWAIDSKELKLHIKVPIEALNKNEKMTIIMSHRPDSNQRPRDYYKTYSPPLYQLSYGEWSVWIPIKNKEKEKEKEKEKDNRKPKEEKVNC